MVEEQEQQCRGVEREMEVSEEGMYRGRGRGRGREEGEGKEENGWGSRDFKRVKQRMNVNVRERNPTSSDFWGV